MAYRCCNKLINIKLHVKLRCRYVAAFHPAHLALLTRLSCVGRDVSVAGRLLSVAGDTSSTPRFSAVVPASAAESDEDAVTWSGPAPRWALIGDIPAGDRARPSETLTVEPSTTDRAIIGRQSRRWRSVTCLVTVNRCA